MQLVALPEIFQVKVVEFPLIILVGLADKVTVGGGGKKIISRLWLAPLLPALSRPLAVIVLLSAGPEPVTGAPVIPEETEPV